MILNLLDHSGPLKTYVGIVLRLLHYPDQNKEIYRISDQGKKIQFSQRGPYRQPYAS